LFFFSFVNLPLLKPLPPYRELVEISWAHKFDQQTLINKVLSDIICQYILEKRQLSVAIFFYSGPGQQVVAGEAELIATQSGD